MQIPLKVPQAGFYYHYKHNSAKGVQDYAYEVKAVGFHIEREEPNFPVSEEGFYVNYRPLYESASVYQASKKLGIECMDNRPLTMWMENVTKGDKTFPRFGKITDPAVIAELKKIRSQMYPVDPSAD